MNMSVIFYNALVFMPLLLLLHCLFIFLFKRWLGPVGTFYASLLSFTVVNIGTVYEIYHTLLTGSYAFIDFGRWFFCLDVIDIHLVFCIDVLALICSTLVGTLTLLALYFGVEYMYREAFINRLLYLLNLFATSVIFLFYCYDYFLIIFAWECIGLFSLLLVNFYSTRIYTIKAAIKTFMFSRISDLFMFIAFILTINVFNTTDLSLIFLQTPFYSFHYIFINNYAVHFLTLFSFCLTTSGLVKSAQFFFHVWLPDAMEAPTPASALIHSSTLVVADIFLVIRFSVVYEFTSFTNYYMALFGAMTLSFAAVVATFQNDIKKLVAYSTISQIGYLVCGCGFACYEEVLLYLISHALNKAFLFILVGYTVHFFSGNTDMRQMGGSYIYTFDIAALLFGVCLNLAGLPYSAGFFGKEFLLFQVLRDDTFIWIIRSCWLVSFLCTPIYMFTLIFMVVFGSKLGSKSVYSSTWRFNFTTNLKVLFLTKGNNSAPVVIYNYLLHQYHFTAVTSRFTSYVLLTFWLFFFFYGESLILIIFNYTSLIDTIPSAHFTTIKQHVIFFINTNPLTLGLYIDFCIFYLTITALVLLLNVGYASKYQFIRTKTWTDNYSY